MKAELDGLKELLGGGVTLELDSSLVSSLLPDPATVPCPALPGLFDSDTLLDIAQEDDSNPATDLNRSLTWNSKVNFTGYLRFRQFRRFYNVYIYSYLFHLLNYEEKNWKIFFLRFCLK